MRAEWTAWATTTAIVEREGENWERLYDSLRMIGRFRLRQPCCFFFIWTSGHHGQFERRLSTAVWEHSALLQRFLSSYLFTYLFALVSLHCVFRLIRCWHCWPSMWSRRSVAKLLPYMKPLGLETTYRIYLFVELYHSISSDDSPALSLSLSYWCARGT